MPVERKDDRSTCRMQERVFDNAIQSQPHTWSAWNRSIIRVHWSGRVCSCQWENVLARPRRLLQSSLYILSFVWNDVTYQTESIFGSLYNFNPNWSISPFLIYSFHWTFSIRFLNFINQPKLFPVDRKNPKTLVK